jgi:xanthine dehydrogenase small subunit
VFFGSIERKESDLSILGASNNLILIRFILNKKEIQTALPPGTLLLDFIRYHQHQMGTKIGCREGDCGACSVLVGDFKNKNLHYQSATSCLTALGNVHGKHVISIEGLNMAELNLAQQAMKDESATQCGFCTPGLIVAVHHLLEQNPSPSDIEVKEAISGNICRCTGYGRIFAAVNAVIETREKSK